MKNKVKVNEKPCLKSKENEYIMKEIKKDYEKYKDLVNKPTFNIYLQNTNDDEENYYEKRIKRILKDYNDYEIINLDRETYDYYRELRFNGTLEELISNNSKGCIMIFYTKGYIEDIPFFRKTNFHKINSYIYNYKDAYEILIKTLNKNDIKVDLSKESYNMINTKLKKYCITFNTNTFIYSTIIRNMNNNSINEEELINIINNNISELEKEKIEISKDKIKEKEFIGLNSISNEIKELLEYASFLKTSDEKNNTYLNMFFLGNPGTGKTMIADYVTSMLYKMNYIKENKVIKILPNDLIAEYTGQTRGKTRKILNDAKGGILFIDEAYLLFNESYTGDNNPFMTEAIIELMKYMEDPTNIVIFAGYKDELRKIYKANRGLKSRIYKEIEFPDYSNEELYKILNNDLKKKGFRINTNTKKNILDHIENLKKDKDFGNARTILKLSQELIIKHINNKNETKEIDSKDIPTKNINSRKVGLLNYVK